MPSFLALLPPYSAGRFTPLAGRAMAMVVALWPLLPTTASADCVNGARDATDEEKTTTVQVLTALRNAFPSPPGWKITHDTKPEAPRFFCKGDNTLRLWFGRTFTRVEGMKERVSEYNRKLTEAKRLTPEEQTQVAEFDKDIAELAKQMSVPRSAMKRRDLDKDARFQLEAEFKRLGDKMAALRQRRQTITNPSQVAGARKKSYEQALTEATRELRQDTEIIVKVTMNGNFEPMKDGARVEIPGVPVAYRSAPRQDMPGAFTEGTTMVFFGQARPQPSGGPDVLEPVIDPANPTKPRTFAVSIQADQDRAMHVIEGMNIESLHALTR